MKNILLATTALVATASTAFAAGVELSGSAEMGIIGGDKYGDVTQFHTDIDVTFSMSGEADNGLTFGASIDLDESDGSNGECVADGAGDISCGIKGASDAFDNTTQGGESIFIAYGAGRLSMGDVDGAFDAALQEAIIGSSINDDLEHLGYNDNSGLDGAYDGQIATASYGFSGFTGFLSVELSDTSSDIDPVWGVGVSYTADLAGLALDLGLGYQQGDESAAEGAAGNITVEPTDSAADLVGKLNSKLRTDVWGLSVGTTFNNGIVGIINYSSANYAELDGFAGVDTGNTETHWGVALGYSMNALTVGANWGQYENFLGIENATVNGWGLVADYDMGGGLEAQFGYGASDIDADGGTSSSDSWSLGLAMSF